MCLFLEMHTKVFRGEITEKKYTYVLVCVYGGVESKQNVQVKVNRSN